MNKLALLFASASLLIFISGCSSFMDPVPKNVFMIKKYNEGNKNNATSITGGVLSVETTKSLGLNAVEKYLGIRLLPDEVQFDVTVVDLNALKELVEHDIRPDEKQNAEESLKEVPEGLFYLTITSPNNERYELVLNAGTGDVLKISNEPQMREVSGGIPSDKTVNSHSEITNKFLQEKEALNPRDFQEDGGLFVEDKKIAYYCFRSIKDNSLKYVIEIDLAKNKITGFNKDIMALLTWNAKVSVKMPSMQE